MRLQDQLSVSEDINGAAADSVPMRVCRAPHHHVWRGELDDCIAIGANRGVEGPTPHGHIQLVAHNGQPCQHNGS